MNQSDFLKYTASEPMPELIEKLYGGGSIRKPIPAKLTAEEARTDILYFRYVMQNAYSGYSHYDKELFDNAFEQMLREADSAGEITPAQLTDLIASKLTFITDGHLSLSAADHCRRFYWLEQTYVSDMRLGLRDTAYYDLASGKEVRFAEPMRVFPTLSAGSTEEFLIGVRSKEVVRDIPVTVGGKRVDLPVHRITSADKSGDFLHKERFAGDVAIVASSGFGSNSEEEKKAMFELGRKCSSYRHVIWDLSNNSGGDSSYPEQFLTGLAGGCSDPFTCLVLESTLVNAKLTGEIKTVETHFAQEQVEERKTHECCFQGHLHVIINDRIASSGEMAVAWAKTIPKVTVYGCNTMGVGRYGDLLIYYMPNSSIILMCPYKLFDLGIQETIGFEPDYWIDEKDTLTAVLNSIGAEKTALEVRSDGE